VPAPVRMPLPPAPFQGSIYENQTTLQNKYFERTAKV
jgi:phytanoyl-CoA hydroxylase